MTERLRAAARRPARVRGRRLAPAAHAAGRAAAAARGGPATTPTTPARGRSSTPRSAEVDRLSAMVSELLLLSRGRRARRARRAARPRRGRPRAPPSAGRPPRTRTMRPWRRATRPGRRCAARARRPRPHPRRAGRERARLRARGQPIAWWPRPARDRGARRGPGPRAGRGGGGVRALPPRPRRAARVRPAPGWGCRSRASSSRRWGGDVHARERRARRRPRGGHAALGRLCDQRPATVVLVRPRSSGPSPRWPASSSPPG